MNTDDAYRLATRLMNEHMGIGHGWKVVYDTATVRFGVCRYYSRTIGLSRKLVELNEEHAVRMVILHEIAHALVSPGESHGPVWQRKCLEIGGDGRAKYSTALVTTVPKPYVATCPVCANTYRRAALPRTRTYVCTSCYRQGHSRPLIWTEARIAANDPDDGLKWRGTVRETGSTVSIWDARKAGLDVSAGRWVTRCEPHNRSAAHATSSMAWTIAAHPRQWCPECGK